MGGSALGVTLFSNVLQYVFGWSPRWIALFAALALAGAGAVVADAVNWLEWVVPSFKGCRCDGSAAKRVLGEMVLMSRMVKM